MYNSGCSYDAGCGFIGIGLCYGMYGVRTAYIYCNGCVYNYPQFHHKRLQLLQLEDFTPEKKFINKKLHTLTVVYFSIATALYLAVSFATGAWSKSWAIWPVAAVLYMAVESFAVAKIKKNK